MVRPLVLSKTSDSVCTIIMNRSEKRNALNTALTEELITALEKADADRNIKVVILTGEGAAFCAGADLREFGDQDTSSHEFRTELYSRLYDFLPEMRKPVIAAVNGFALGGGCALLLSCDMAIAASSASFGYPEIAFGMVGRGVLPPLIRAVGPKAAFDLLVSGRRIGAEEGLRLGMISRICDQHDFLSFVQNIAAEIALFPLEAVAATKKHVLKVSDMNLSDGLDYVRSQIKV
jgi:enoyl-CoA hydratase/carnithine racemase